MNRLLLPILLASISFVEAASQVSFSIPITVSVGNQRDTLHLGVNPGNTVGVDDAAEFGEFRESMAPPVPPPPFPFDARFVTLPGRVTTYPTGLGSGVFRDYRGYSNPAQVDSFRIKLDGALGESDDAVISWPPDLRNYATSWIIKPIAGSDWPQTDMTTASSVTLPPFTQRTAIIIKSGAFVTSAQTVPAPNAHSLQQNHPNPFFTSTKITFTLPVREAARVEIFNSLGESVRLLADAIYESGAHSLEFAAGGLPAGVYLCRLSTPTHSAVRMMVLAR